MNDITKRSVLYVGHKCNSNCQFCYYKHKKNKNWREIEDIKKEATRYRYFYNHEFVDITGGEPTIYPNILELIYHCNSIGLKPTIITNAFALENEKKCKEFKLNGINDFLISIFGIGKNTDVITGIKNTYKKQNKALKNLQKLIIPFRFNVTVHKNNYNQLTDISHLAIQKKVKIVNLIIFNPFYEWKNIDNIDFEEKYSKISKYIKKAIVILEKNKIEVNVRYLPFCMLKGFEKNVYNYMQLSYDRHEWNFNSWFNYFLFNPNEEWYEKEALRIRKYECDYQKSESCMKCSLNYICDGFQYQYAKRFGLDEANPYKLNLDIKNPKFFINKEKDLNTSYSQTSNRARYLLKDKTILYDIINNRIRYLRTKVSKKNNIN